MSGFIYTERAYSVREGAEAMSDEELEKSIEPAEESPFHKISWDNGPSGPMGI